MTQVILEREDWTLFRDLNKLGQKAGVPKERLARLVVKELVDNALDAGGSATLSERDGMHIVEDDGPGIAGADEEIASLFSIRRPMRSSKLIRLPTRGALGNGLRVVAGAVLSSGGNIVVRTRGRSLTLDLHDNGTTTVAGSQPWDGVGTTIEIQLGPHLETDPDPQRWGKMAIEASKVGEGYKGKSSPFWYDTDAFFELCQASGDMLIRDLVATLDGCSGGKAGRICQEHHRRPARELTRKEAEAVLLAARREAREVKPARLGRMGAAAFGEAFQGYATASGTFNVRPGHGGLLGADIPFVVEAWSEPAPPGDTPACSFYVNRTPITARMAISRSGQKGYYYLSGCSLSSNVEVGKNNDVRFCVNIQSPHMPLTTDGKAPDFSAWNLRKAIEECMRKAGKQCRRPVQPKATEGAQRYQNREIIAALPEAIDKVSGGRKIRYSLRQLFYAIRPRLLEVFGKEPDYDYFSSVVADYEDETGQELPFLYRDNRGTLYHPHTGEEIPLGTLNVEQYRRPAWTFNKILYCEKEGFFPQLKASKWPERHDCALLTSKGFATRAARDVLAFLGKSDEPITFYCIHDADGPGTLIFERLQEAVAEKSNRKVVVVNLGLEPAEGREMGLVPEPVAREGGKKVAVAKYVPAGDREWLQRHRIELNAMTSPQFIGWLDAKMEEQGSEKLIPPQDVLAETFDRNARSLVRQHVVDEVLRIAGIDGLAEQAMHELAPEIERQAEQVEMQVREELDEDPAQRWSEPIQRLAEEAVKGCKVRLPLAEITGGGEDDAADAAGGER